MTGSDRHALIGVLLSLVVLPSVLVGLLLLAVGANPCGRSWEARPWLYLGAGGILVGFVVLGVWWLLRPRGSDPEEESAPPPASRVAEPKGRRGVDDDP